MAILNLSNQQAAVDSIEPYIIGLKNRMDQRRQMWDKLPFKKKKRWVLSDKDPIMSLAWSIYKYLDEFFGSEEIKDD